MTVNVSNSDNLTFFYDNTELVSLYNVMWSNSKNNNNNKNNFYLKFILKHTVMRKILHSRFKEKML